MTEDDHILNVMQEFFSLMDEVSSAQQRLAAGEPEELAAAPTPVQEYVNALHVEGRRLQQEVERLRSDLEALDDDKDTEWYGASIDADIATSGDGAEADVNWDSLFKERQRLHALERTLRDAQAIHDALGRRDLDALAVSVDRLLRRVERLEGPGGGPHS